MKHKKGEDIIIATLRFGKENLGKGATHAQFVQHLKSKGYDLAEDQRVNEIFNRQLKPTL